MSLNRLFGCLWAAAILLCSCSTDNPEQEHRIAFAQNPMLLLFDAATYDCGLITDGNWTATTGDSWITINTPSGTPKDKLSITLALNSGDLDRNGTVKVKAGSSCKSLVVCQSGVVGSGFLDKTSVTFDTYSTTQKIFVSCEGGWSVTNADGDWFKYEKVSPTQLSVTSEVNYSGAMRSGSLVVSADDGSRSATVSLKQNFTNEKFLASTEYGRRFVYAAHGYITSVSHDTCTELADGVTAFEMTCRWKDDFAGESSALQRKIFLFDVDLDKATVIATLPNDDDASYGTSVTQKMTEQIAALASGRPSLDVIGGVNGDYFQIETKPYTIQGVLYRGGKCFKDTFQDGVCTAFAILDDGTAVCLNQSEYPSYKSRIREAVGARMNLVQNGSMLSFSDTRLEPRTVTGASKDGHRAYLLIVDGRADLYGTGSYGASYEACAKLMLAAGAHEAVNNDGGGSSTFVVRSGSSYVFHNKPGNSGNKERAVFDGLAIVKNR